MAKPETKINRETQIQAIEAKLKLMEHKSSDDFEINKTVANEIPVISQYQYNKQQSNTSNNIRYKKFDRHSKPYNKARSRR